MTIDQLREILQTQLPYWADEHVFYLKDRVTGQPLRVCEKLERDEDGGVFLVLEASEECE